MGWVYGDSDDGVCDHEGWCVAVLGNGTEPDPIQVPLTSAADETRTVLQSAWWLYDGQEGRPRAVAVRAACACGWRSTDMFPVDFDNHEATGGWERNEGPHAAWRNEHIEQLLGTTVPAELAEAIETVRRMLAGLAVSRPLAAIAAAADVEKLGTARLQEAVTAARRREESWEVIGKAARVSRQAAHQRFSKVLLPRMVEPPAS